MSATTAASQYVEIATVETTINKTILNFDDFNSPSFQSKLYGWL